MAVNARNWVVVVVLMIVAAGIGFLVGNQNSKSKSPPLANLATEKSPGEQVVLEEVDLDKKSMDDLTARLSKVMLPDEEYNKLNEAIHQTAMSLLTAQAQGAGIEVPASLEQELKDSISKKYSRQYFSDMNALSMKELSSDELKAIIAFYDTAPGKKFLELSPKIIESTMASVQADLSKWLPETVEMLFSKLKGEKSGGVENPKVNQKDPQAQEPLFDDKGGEKR